MDAISVSFPFLPPPVYAQVFNEADKDGDGNLTYTEFERVMYFYPEFYKLAMYFKYSNVFRTKASNGIYI